MNITLLMFGWAGHINAQKTLPAIEHHFDSICMNCNIGESDMMMYKACKKQDSLIAEKRKTLLSILKIQQYHKNDSSSLVSGFDKLVEIGNEKKKNVIAVFGSLFSGSMLSSQAGIITYYLNEQTIELLDFYIESNTQ